MHLLNKSGEPPPPNPLPPGERGVIERNHLKNSLPLNGGGLGWGVKSHGLLSYCLDDLVRSHIR